MTQSGGSVRISELPIMSFEKLSDDDLVIINDQNYRTRGVLLGDFKRFFPEEDPVFSISPASSIALQDINRWNAAFAWGDHNIQGYLKEETDPVFTASPAFTIKQSDIDYWNSSTGGTGGGTFQNTGNLPLSNPTRAGGYAEIIVGNSNNRLSLPPTLSTQSDANEFILDTLGKVIDNSGNLVNEKDPVFRASPAFNISSQDLTHFRLAYSWGDHRLGGYLKFYTETDPVFSASPAASITLADIANWNSGTGGGGGGGGIVTETDPVFLASPAYKVTDDNLDDWNEAYSWGDHSTQGYIDALHPSYQIDSDDIDNWNESYGWGDHSQAGYAKTLLELDDVNISGPLNNQTLVYNGNEWVNQRESSVVYSDIVPSTVGYETGQLWVESDTNELYVLSDAGSWMQIQ